MCCYSFECYLCLKKNLNASRLLSIPHSREGNVKTFSTWDHRLQIQNLFMTFERVPR